MHTIENFACENCETESQVELHWQSRIDALLCGECGEGDFIDELSSLRQAAPDSAWNVIALLYQRYRRGQMPVALFHSIKSKVVQDGMAVDNGMTIDLDLAFAKHRDAPIRITDVSGLGDHTHTDASAPQATPLQTPQASMEDRSELSVPEIGRVLRNRYVLESCLGCGGMGTVFKAMDRYRCDLPEDNRHIAIKFLREETDNRPELSANLRREFYCAQALSHRSIVKVYELDRDDDFEFFTMELLEGELLSSVLERSHPYSISRSYAWAIILEIGDGLAHAHARNVVHGDLKPKNIIITNSGELRILDFGASHAPTRERSSAAEPQKVNLTPAYACCELWEGQQADPRDDLYALACVAYELLAGEHPFQGLRSTEARKRGLTPRRPPGLSGRQWQTLAMGLSWYREGRSIPVRDWIAKLKPGEAAVWQMARLLDFGREIPVRDWIAKLKPGEAVARQMARLLDFGREIPVRDWIAKLHPGEAVARQMTRLLDRSSQLTMQSRTIAILAILLVSLTVWVSFNHLSFERKIGSNDAVPKAAANAPTITDPLKGYQNFLPDGNLLPESALMGPSLPDILSRGSRTSHTVQFPATVESGATRAALHNKQLSKISISADTYRIRSRENFAEIQVRRSPGYGGDTTFVWWTEPSSAKPGIDYVPQARMTQLLPKGRRLASIFVRIIPNASRKHAAMFYVNVGDPGNGTTAGHLARTAILLAPSS